MMKCFEHLFGDLRHDNFTFSPSRKQRWRVEGSCDHCQCAYQFGLGHAIRCDVALQISKQLHGQRTYFFPGGAAFIGWNWKSNRMRMFGCSCFCVGLTWTICSPFHSVEAKGKRKTSVKWFSLNISRSDSVFYEKEQKQANSWNDNSKNNVTYCGFIADVAFDDMLVRFALYVDHGLADFAVDHGYAPRGGRCVGRRQLIRPDGRHRHRFTRTSCCWWENTKLIFWKQTHKRIFSPSSLLSSSSWRTSPSVKRPSMSLFRSQLRHPNVVTKCLRHLCHGRDNRSMINIHQVRGGVTD